MEILFTADSAETVRDAGRRSDSWCGLGSIPYFSGFFLLHAKRTCRGCNANNSVCFCQHFFCLGLYENREYLGSRHSAFSEQSSVVGDGRPLFAKCAGEPAGGLGDGSGDSACKRRSLWIFPVVERVSEKKLLKAFPS